MKKFIKRPLWKEESSFTDIPQAWEEKRQQRRYLLSSECTERSLMVYPDKPCSLGPLRGLLKSYLWFNKHLENIYFDALQQYFSSPNIESNVIYFRHIYSLLREESIQSMRWDMRYDKNWWWGNYLLPWQLGLGIISLVRMLSAVMERWWAIFTKVVDSWQT